MSDTPDQQLVVHAARLADAVEGALPGWVRSKVRQVLDAQGISIDPPIEAAIEAAADLAQFEIGGAVRRLLEADVDDQPTTPLALLRQAVEYPTAVLRACGAAPVARDRFAAEAFPLDAYDLNPASFADLDPAAPELAEAGLTWGAAKAFVHRHRHNPG